MVKTKMRNIVILKNYLLRPFGFVSQRNILRLGLAAMILAGSLNSLSYTHFDGILDVHSGKSGPFFAFLLQGFLNSFIVSLTFFILIKFIFMKRVKISHIFVEQIFARWPFIFISLFTLTEVYKRPIKLLSLKYIHMNKDVLITSMDYVVIGFIFFLFLVITAWVVYLMYRSFSNLSQTSGFRGISVFILGLLFAEVISKLIYN